MANKVVKCSNCGSPLKDYQNVSQYKCPYCGSINIIDIKTKEKKSDIPLDKYKLLKKAAKYEGNSNVDKAIELYDAFLQINPQSDLVLLARALISLADSPNDDLNEELFDEYFKKGFEVAPPDKIEALGFLMYQFAKYTIPLICVWQVYAYKKLCDIDKKRASARMSRNMSILFKVQNKIDNLVENAKFSDVNDLSASEMETYEDFKIAIINFDNDLLKYNDWYDLRLDKWDIKASIKSSEKSYKRFCKKHKRGN